MNKLIYYYFSLILKLKSSAEDILTYVYCMPTTNKHFHPYELNVIFHMDPYEHANLMKIKLRCL